MRDGWKDAVKIRPKTKGKLDHTLTRSSCTVRFLPNLKNMTNSTVMGLYSYNDFMKPWHRLKEYLMKRIELLLTP